MNYITLGIGLVILVKGADILIGSASKLAKIFNVPSFVVGLFIIAIGTSAPEAAVGFFSGIQGNNLITLGDVIGSCIVNITVIIGITAMISPLEVDSSVPRREMIISIFVQALLVFMMFTSNTLSRGEAIVLLIGMLLFSGYVYIKSRRGSEHGIAVTEFENEVYEYVDMQEEVLYEEESSHTSELESGDVDKGAIHSKQCRESVPKLIILVIVGLAGLIVGANMGVNSAVKIAHNLGLSEAVIGLTVVAVGTSLPELVTSLVAVYKKEEDIAVGNIVGSNIFNILFVLGLSGTIHPIEADTDIFFDLFAMVGASIVLFIPAYFFGKISKLIGFFYLTAYILYLALKLNSLG